VKAVQQPIQTPFAKEENRWILLFSLSGTIESCMIVFESENITQWFDVER